MVLAIIMGFIITIHLYYVHICGLDLLHKAEVLYALVLFCISYCSSRFFHAFACLLYMLNPH